MIVGGGGTSNLAGAISGGGFGGGGAGVVLSGDVANCGGGGGRSAIQLSSTNSDLVATADPDHIGRRPFSTRSPGVGVDAAFVAGITVCSINR